MSMLDPRPATGERAPGAPPRAGGARLLVEERMEAVEVVPFCGGTLALFSTPSPTKATANEDAAALVPVGSEAGVLLVADGAGGLRGGAQASRVTVHAVRAALERDGAGRGLREAILTGIDDANRSVTTLEIGAATTLAVVELRSRRLRSYHVGDTEVLVLGAGGNLRYQTISHSPMGYAVEIGLLSEDEAMRHEDRHFVYNVVGTPEMRVDVGPELELEPGDTVLIACDGLFDNLAKPCIADLLRGRDLEAATGQLVARCREQMLRGLGDQPSKPDDLTLLAFRLD